jgi:hypothetical protein
MKRREFMAASAAAVAVAALGSLPSRAAAPEGRQWYELRTYSFASDAKQQAYEQFLHDAFVPALNRAEVKPVGVFRLHESDNPQTKLTGEQLRSLYVMLPHDTLESMAALNDRLANDGTFQSAGHAIITAPASDPAFARYQSTLLHAMKNFPRVKVLDGLPPDRLLQLRTYQSPNPERARNKLEMFNKGEFGAFARAGMTGIFFGGAIIGQDLPQLTYMVAHKDAASVDPAWKAFRVDPGWKKLSGDKQYAGNVSKIINLLVRPCAASQI